MKVSLKDAALVGGSINETREKALFCRDKKRPRLYAAYVKKLERLMQLSFNYEKD